MRLTSAASREASLNTLVDFARVAFPHVDPQERIGTEGEKLETNLIEGAAALDPFVGPLLVTRSRVLNAACKAVACAMPDCAPGMELVRVGEANPEKGVCCPAFQCRPTTDGPGGPCAEASCSVPTCEEGKKLTEMLEARPDEGKCCSLWDCLDDCSVVACAMPDCAPGMELV